MKTLFLIILACTLLCENMKAKSIDSFPPAQWSIYGGIGIVPYGTESISVKSNSPSYDQYSGYFGICFQPFEKTGLFAEGHFFQRFASDEWIPFHNVSSTNGISTLSHSFNFGVQFLDRIAPKFEVSGKLGLGLTWSNYNQNSIPSNTPAEHKINEPNFQITAGLRYYATEHIGITHSFSLSKLLPVWQLGMVYDL